MPRLGGGTYKQSYLVSNGGSSSLSQVIETRRSSSEPVLPITITPPSSHHGEDVFPVPRQSRQFKASESGSGSLLPDHTSTRGGSRIRTLSDMSSSSPRDDSPNGGLRRRSTLILEEDQVHKLARPYSLAANLLPLHRSPPASRPSSPRPQRTFIQVTTKGGFTLGHFVQALVVCIVFYLVYDANHKVKEAASRLDQYKAEETALMDQMDRIETRARQLQDQLQTLQKPNDVEEVMYRWKRDFFEGNKEVHALQDFMQDGARKSIVQTYGEGAIHVKLDLDLGVKSSAIAVEMFDDTPHAAWVFLQQIVSGDWEGASFIWHPSHMILASPSKAATHKLEFMERSQHYHDAWTIGLTPSHNGGYNLYINLQDNAHVHDGDVCLGKVIDGFDTLQRLMHRNTANQSPGSEKTYLDPPIAIQQMSISANRRSRTRRY